jgi:hypothetical protein
VSPVLAASDESAISAEYVRGLLAQIARLQAEAAEKEAKGGKGSSEEKEQDQ